MRYSESERPEDLLGVVDQVVRMTVLGALRPHPITGQLVSTEGSGGAPSVEWAIRSIPVDRMLVAGPVISSEGAEFEHKFVIAPEAAQMLAQILREAADRSDQGEH
jgi:hypothetical protein